MIESVDRIEPTRLEDTPEAIADVIAELSGAAAGLGHALHSRTAANLADLVRIMNTYYSNLIEGHDTRPRDIERVLAGELDRDEGRRNLQLEARAHVRVQAEVDRMAAAGTLPEPASREFIRWLHREFYRDAPEATLRLHGAGREFLMVPGQWRNRPDHDVAVGRHLPPSSQRVAEFMRHFESRFRFDGMGKAGRVMAIAAAHHRLNYIHPPRRKRPRESADEPRHGACRRHRRARPLVGFPRPGSGTAESQRVQGHDGPCRHAAAG